MQTLPNLIWIRSFEAASRLGSFTAAGQELGLTQAAVSNHISSLESQLGHQLMERTTRKVDLTASGKAYLPAVRKALQDLAGSTEGLFGNRTPGSVTIRAPISESVLIIAPALPGLQLDHPGLDIRLLSAIWADTVLETGIDLEIRLGTGYWPNMRSEALGTEFVVPVCHPEFTKKLKKPSDLIEKKRIHTLGFDDHWERYFEELGLDPPSRSAGVTVDTSLAAVELAAAQGGVALVLERIALRLAATGRLVIPFETKIPSSQSHYLLHRENAGPQKPVARVVEAWLRQLFAGDG
ncbi:LysR substrate-binding domain-containing protein [uncultured Roseibium sp.]|uniref:LysR substrate-binding domain-containing protein n=1 Tax=uncultured Roseibium sp. TaxID=1936171 RepID=UPI00262CDD5E|nr:LysR substrate-binding domain-containing protein [uncultured Roseibium sp.]